MSKNIPQQYLYDKDNRNTYHKLWFLRFVMNQFHRQKHSCTAAESRNDHQSSFFHTPFMADSFSFVRHGNSHSNDIDNNEIEGKKNFAVQKISLPN